MGASTPANRATAIKVVASVFIVTLGGGFVLKSSMKAGAEYYKHVDEVMGNIDSLRGKRLQVHGNVVDGSIEQAKGTLLYRFKIESRAPRAPAVITATYNGLVPDTFKSGAEVVAKGTLTPDNQLDVVADGIMAKCPSKYNADEQKPAAPGSNAAAAASVAAKI
jgi:cytochrome c-type biogenesis protein CcmE